VDRRYQRKIFRRQALYENRMGPVIRSLSSTFYRSWGKNYIKSTDFVILQAVCDFPSCAFAEELIATYPDAKVILTNRPVEAWYTSCIGTIRQSMTSPLLYFIGYFDTEVMGKWTVMTRLLFNGFFDFDFEKNGRRVFEQQYSRVRELVPKDRLLEFELGDGWEKLCPFLEVDIPEVGYPRVNEATAFKDRNALRFRLAVQRGMPRIVATVTAVAGVFSAGALFYYRKW